MADDGGINWKELMVDKSIDVILVPLGLFAALWFQGVVDDRKAREEYKLLLRDFQAEVDVNKSKAKAFEDDLGLITEAELEKALGPLQAKFDGFKAKSVEAVADLACLDAIIDTQIKAPETVTAEDKKAAETCAADMEKREDSATEVFSPVDLAPLYRYEVWQVYLATGIKLFKEPESKQIGLKIGEIYSAAKEVEKRVEDIEKVINDSFMERQGEITGIEAQLGDLLGDDAGPDDYAEAQKRLPGFADQVFEAKYAITSVEAVVKLKVQRLKTYMVDMNKKFDALRAELETEINR